MQNHKVPFSISHSYKRIDKHNLTEEDVLNLMKEKEKVIDIQFNVLNWNENNVSKEIKLLLKPK